MLTVALWLTLSTTTGFAAVTSFDDAVVRAVAAVRWRPLTDVARALVFLSTGWPVRAVVWATIGTLIVVRRLHHLVVYLGLLLGTTVVAIAVSDGIARPRPGGVQILAAWDGFAQPSWPVVAWSLALCGATFTLVPPGRRRRRAAVATALAIAVVSAARLYLGLDHLTDLAAAVALGVAVPVLTYPLATPAEAFPVFYRRGNRAHLDIGGARRAALVRALGQQLGLGLVEVEPFGLGGSAGSTPLRLRVRTPDRTEMTLFGKLYATTHLRSDRWYKLARTVLYGRLEDEKPYSSVRRLVEYEDHLLRLSRDAGLPTPAPFGIVELTPEREYVLVMEFFDGAREIDAVELTDAQIDDALHVVRRMWAAGVAHRDIKPSNLLVRDEQVLLIDVAFATVRPTPWRQAVDLANMMLTLALRSSPEKVYDRALQQFAAADVAEAFAATRSITMPTQLRSRLRTLHRNGGRDLVTEFRALAPARAPISIQLWGLRRVLVTIAVLVGATVAVAALAGYAQLAGLV